MSPADWTGACPAPKPSDDRRVLLAHGEGGRLMRRLLRERIVPHYSSPQLAQLGDAAVLPELAGRPVLTTDGFVVSPLFFPGGDIGSLAVYGTVNDLVVAGAEPLWLSVALVMEEGLSLDVVERVLASIGAAARACGVAVVTGDTKVVPRGAVDQLFVTTTGLGRLLDPAPAGPASLVDGDAVLVTGPIGRHGTAVMCARDDLGFAPPPTSDSAPLAEAAAALRGAGIVPRAMRDATRGGAAAVLHEWAEASRRTMTITEDRVPVAADVRGVCELLGIDPLFVANEGTMLVAVAAEQAEAARAALRTCAVAAEAAVIGTVRPRGIAPVAVVRALGREVPLDEPAGAPLPRIC